MLGDFSYSNPTKLYFESTRWRAPKGASAYGKNVLLVYGGGSIRKTGSTTVSRSLKACGKEIVEDGGVAQSHGGKALRGCRRGPRAVELTLAGRRIGL